LTLRLSDAAVLSGTARVDAAERARRISRFHAPYHAAIDAAIERSLATGGVPMVVSLHSFTPGWRGTPRPWQGGILSDLDRRLADPLIAGLAGAGIVVGDN